MSSKSTGKSVGATSLAGRYANALLNLADEEKALDVVAADMADMDKLLTGNAELARLITSPVHSREDQGAALDAVLDKAGAHKLTRNFVGVAAANRRLRELQARIAAFRAELSLRRGETTAGVASPEKLTAKQLDAIGAILKKALGGKVAIDATVDPGLLGGLVVRVGSRMVDSSLRTKLQKMRLAMKGIG